MPQSNQPQIRLIIKGDVQGVGFRAQSKKWAKQYGVGGWVRNEPNGTVTIVAQGEKDTLEKLAAWCRWQAPGRVESVESRLEESGLEFCGFEIRYLNI